MTPRTRTLLSGTISGAVGTILGALIWFFSNLPNSPDPYIWQIVLVSGTTFVSFHIGISFREAGDGDDGGSPELEPDSEPLRQA